MKEAMPSEPVRDVRELGLAYQDARRAYGLTSALLFGWELVGVEISAAPLENVKVYLKSPQALPYVLLVLTFYFAFRLTVEWYQTDSRRRSLAASRVDFAIAHAIGVSSVALYAVQAFPGWPLKMGDKGDAVTFIQQRLETLGCYDTKGDGAPSPGQFDNPTAMAVIRFQQANKLSTEDYGMVGVVQSDLEFRRLANPFASVRRCRRRD